MISILLVVMGVMGVWIWHYHKLYKEQEVMATQLCEKLDNALGLSDKEN